MMLQFYKMTGADHDFVMVDNRDLSLSSVLSRENIKDICQRRFGIGADGVIAVEPAQKKGVVRMRYYNADGAEAGMDDNSALCFTAFVDFLLDGNAKTIRFETDAGAAKGRINEDDSVTVQLAERTITGPALIVFCGEVIICEG